MALPLIPIALVAGAGMIAGAGATYKVSKSARETIDKATEFAGRIEKPLVVLAALGGLFLLLRS